jgi:hypothetical protein
MHPWALSAFGAVTLIILGVTEYLFQTSQRHTGLFTKNAGDTRYVFRETVAQFFSLFVLVLAGLYFYDMDQVVKIMEPFYHLSKPEGELGSHSLCVDYFRVPVYFTPIQALYHRHWAVACSATTNVVATNVLPTLALGIFVTDRSDMMSTAMDPLFTRSFEAFCGFLSVLSFTLCVIVSGRKTGIDGFPNRFLALMKYTARRERPDSVYNFIKGLRLEDGDEISEGPLEEHFGPRRFQLLRPKGSHEEDTLEIVLRPNRNRTSGGLIGMIAFCAAYRKSPGGPDSATSIFGRTVIQYYFKPFYSA